MADSARHAQVGLNGALVEAAAARISPLSDGFQYGQGLFETVKLLGGRPVFMAEHVERLRQGAADLGLSIADGLAARCDSVVRANGAEDGVLKIVVFQDEGGPGELILTRDHPYPAEAFERGFGLMTIADGQRAGRLPSLKTLNYLKNLAGRRAARAEGFDEALFVGPDGSILEGAVTNVCVVAGEWVLTPPLDAGILPGIARSRVLRLPPAGRIREHAVAASLLYAADEIFVTNSLLGVMPVSRIDRHDFPIDDNPVTRGLQEAFRKAELESLNPIPLRR